MSQPTKDFDRYKWMKEPIIKPKKLTFDAWWESTGVWSYGHYVEKQQAEGIWQSAQENK